jgi:hypothetical protein
MGALNGWENFYVIVGSSAGALIGLQFVVITLIADMPVIEGGTDVRSAFTTPSVIHFGAVLFLSALVSAPWNGLSTVAVVWGLGGTGGVLYTLNVARRMRIQTVYKPVLEDWLFHAILPCAAYAMIAWSAIEAGFHARPAMFFTGGAALLLLLSGIHNAWDTVTHLVFIRKHERK